MPLHRDTSRHFDQRLRLVASVVDLDPGLDLLRAQLGEFQRTAGAPVLDRLAEAVTTGADTTILFAAALAENASTPASHNEVLIGVRDRIHRMIRDRYAATATTTYASVATVFDAAAAKFAAAATAVDIEADPEVVLDLPDKARKAWQAAPALADDLDRLAGVLHAAAILAEITDDTDEDFIRLTVDPADEAVRAVWNIREDEAHAARTAAASQPFTGQPVPTRSRCGRWGAVLAAGATIRALDPATVTEPEPKTVTA